MNVKSLYRKYIVAKLTNKKINLVVDDIDYEEIFIYIEECYKNFTIVAESKSNLKFQLSEFYEYFHYNKSKKILYVSILFFDKYSNIPEDFSECISIISKKYLNLDVRLVDLIY